MSEEQWQELTDRMHDVLGWVMAAAMMVIILVGSVMLALMYEGLRFLTGP